MGTKLTPNHKTYRVMLQDRYPVLAIGSQGTGKTYGAVEQAVADFKNGKVRQIIASRPNVPFAETLGFLPGTQEEKMEPWVKPMKDLFAQFMNPSEVDDMMRHNRLQFIPFEHIQGLTFDNSFIILDEAQNASFNQLKIFLGRQGIYSKAVICGDIKQTSDKFRNTGIGELATMVRNTDAPCGIVEFTLNDCLRSDICKQWLQAFEDWEDETTNKR